MSLFLLSQWIVLLLVALYAVYKGTDIILVGAKQIASSLGLSSRYYESVLVGMVSAFPVLALALTGVFIGQAAMVVPVVMGSTLISLVCIGGMVICVGGSRVLWQDVHTTMVPVFCLSVAFFVVSVLDGRIDRLESLLLLGTFCIFVGSLCFVLYSENEHKKFNQIGKSFSTAAGIYLVFGVIAVVVGAKFSLAMVVNIATALPLSVSLISITALACGATVPTYMRTLKALQRNDTLCALGIIFGAVMFSLLVVSSVAGLWLGNLVVGDMVRTLGVPVLVVGSIGIVVSALTRQLLPPVGLIMLLLFWFFFLKLAAYIG